MCTHSFDLLSWRSEEQSNLFAGSTTPLPAPASYTMAPRRAVSSQGPARDRGETIAPAVDTKKEDAAEQVRLTHCVYANLSPAQARCLSLPHYHIAGLGTRFNVERQ